MDWLTIAAALAGLLALNWRWAVAWRAVLLYGIAWVALTQGFPGVAAPGHDPLAAIGEWIPGLVLVMPFFAFGLRAVLHLIWQAPRSSALPLDPVLAGAVGAALAGWFYIGAAWVFAGFDRVLLAHLLVLVPPILALALAWWLPFHGVRFAAAGGLVAVLLLTPLSLAWYPAFLRAEAAAFADGRPWCLMLQTRKRSASGALDLAFLTLDKMRGHPHLVLVTGPPEAPVLAGWSYLGPGFHPLNHTRDALVCRP